MSFDTQLQHLVEEALREDIGDGDHSTLSCIDPEAIGKAVLRIKQEGILAGMEVARKIFAMREPTAVFHPFKKDGDPMQYGETAFEVEAHVHTILQCERLVLNCMQRMSGIATLTRTYSRKLEGFSTQLLDTRKTTPNFRLLEKEAVRIGGGVNHRFGLYDMIMLKDNHIDYCGGIEKAIAKAIAYVEQVKPGLKIEVETRNLTDLQLAVAAGTGKVARLMLDNFTPEQVYEALEWMETAGVRRAFETEASGGIHIDNIQAYAATGVDFVSVGSLIHQAKSLDLSLKAVLL